MAALLFNVLQIDAGHIVMRADFMDGIIDVGLQFGIENEIDFCVGIERLKIEEQLGHGGTEGVKFLLCPFVPFVFTDRGIGPTVIGAAADENQRRIAKAIGARHKAEAAEVFCIIACIADS